ncbi:hypothetical protein BABINDRAFT_163416 [Babjeviella inositovora NRRL Y-12698]|uniref:Glutamate decarboxylase n=1 Tax=Babjeviella inositovora NRRL Y-12698 TaxID=984486 RepID=A0A1E3QJ80_9ASCO|nr:uncharacterized protein BABINDRAFT_163416 [Babjeviella inositovora NRRL Y-12698]ODQ77710.1 hypothetical protein BABINDRAFT_163416 [Babjeviella inositovora NRRL Y-12698]
MSPVIACDLEANRVEELERLLTEVKEKVVKYVASAAQPGASIGPRLTPQEVTEGLNLQLSATGSGEEGLLATFDDVLQYSVNTWHPGFLDKLYASTNPVGVVSDLLLSVLNTNSHVFTVSPALSVIERRIGREYANMFGYTGAHAGGLTFSGGSYSNITSLQVARSILYPETKARGNYLRFATFASKHAHYSIEKSAILLGMGSDGLFRVNVADDGTMDVVDLEAQILRARAQGFTPLYVNATAGTTVYGSFDPFREISAVAKKHGLWFHVDGSWGANVVFSETHRHKVAGIELADSITTNPHKMLGVPTTCSFLLLPDEHVFQTANSLDAPYLFHNAEGGDNYDLADGTMGCGRRADSLKLFLAWQYFGTRGFAARIDHAFAITAYFSHKIAQTAGFRLVSSAPPPCFQVCFYYQHDAQFDDGERNTRATRFIAKRLHATGQFLVDYAPNPGSADGEFFRVVFNSPVVTSDTCDQLIAAIEAAGRVVQNDLE